MNIIATAVIPDGYFGAKKTRKHRTFTRRLLLPHLLYRSFHILHRAGTYLRGRVRGSLAHSKSSHNAPLL